MRFPRTESMKRYDMFWTLEIAKNGGKLTPQQMYEAVKRYKTYIAHNKRLEGKGASLSASQPKATGHTSGYKPRFHKTMAFAATIPEAEDDGPGHPNGGGVCDSSLTTLRAWRVVCLNVH